MGCSFSTSQQIPESLRQSKNSLENKFIGVEDYINEKDGENDVETLKRVDDAEKISIRAAIFIQNWYRRYKAQLEAKRRCNWMIYQSIEYAGEQDQLKLHNFFMELFDMMEKDDSVIQQSIKNGLTMARINQKNVDVAEEDRELVNSLGIEKISVDASYTGPKLRFPLDTQQVMNMLEQFRNGKLLHARYLLELLNHTRLTLKLQPNILCANTQISKKISIVGDIHGQLEDLETIFYKNLTPDLTNPYVFNGDFVDRGNQSVEVACILFAFFLLYPTSVYLNRGNHEDHIMNIRYGFVKEIETKYKAKANKVVRMFKEVFSWLPLATVIDEKILVCHGGISDSTCLDTINKLERNKYISILQPPIGTTFKSANHSEWLQVLDLLWSDPRPQPGCLQNDFRGGGCYFGPDITETVLKKHNLKLLIRSHECKLEGYEWHHNNQVLTIFSASNYYAFDSNRAAFIKFDVELTPHIIQFTVKPKDGSERRKSSVWARNCRKITKEALMHLNEKILANKTGLLEKFVEYDIDQTGKITFINWCQAMTQVLQLNLPWRTLRPELVRMCDDTKLIVYESLFDEKKLTASFENPKSTGIAENLYKHRNMLETIFRIIDKDNSGKISQGEFEDACHILQQHSSSIIWTPQAIKDMAATIDINKDGVIDFNEFLEAFRITDSTAIASSTSSASSSLGGGGSGYTAERAAEAARQTAAEVWAE